MVDVVYVDDEVRNCQLVDAIVEDSLNLEIYSYQNPVDAIRYVGDDQPKVVILDFSMPEINGADAKTLMQDRWPNAKFIMLTAHADNSEVRRMCESARFDVFMTKPLDIPTFKKTVTELVNASKV